MASKVFYHRSNYIALVYVVKSGYGTAMAMKLRVISYFVFISLLRNNN